MMAGLPEIQESILGGIKLVNTVSAELDQDWVELILIARKLGFSKEDIRDFLEREGKKEE